MSDLELFFSDRCRHRTRLNDCPQYKWFDNRYCYFHTKLEARLIINEKELELEPWID